MYVDYFKAMLTHIAVAAVKLDFRQLLKLHVNPSFSSSKVLK
jgi:hypothetical protein